MEITKSANSLRGGGGRRSRGLKGGGGGGRMRRRREGGSVRFRDGSQSARSRRGTRACLRLTFLLNI